MYITTSNPSNLYDLTNASLNSGELTQRVNSAMASGAIAPQTSFPLCRKPIISYLKPISISSLSSQKSKPRAKKDRIFIANSMAAEEMKAIPVMVNEESGDQVVVASQVNDLVSQGHGTLSYGGIPLPSGSGNNDNNNNEEDFLRLMDRGINAAIVLAAGTFAVTKLLTIDSDSWHGWTLYEIIRYAPQHNWTAYEEALKENPVLAKMVISGVVYSLGDWIAQCVEGKPLFEFDRTRMFRSGLVGFTLHGSLSHYYYQICEELFPFQGWWVVPVKVAFDQTVWSGIWNSIYFTVLGFLRFENPANIFSELTATFWPMLTAGWKLWPFAHLITYGLIPVEQRLLWVDCVELIWVTILSTLSNEKSEARIAETPEESSSSSTPTGPLEE